MLGTRSTLIERLGIAPEGHLVVGAAVDVVEDRPRQALARQAPEILEIMALAQTHGRSPASTASAPMRSGKALTNVVTC